MGIKNNNTLQHIEKYGIFYILISYFLIRLNYIDFVPIWDGYIYYDGLLKAVQSPFSLLNFNIVGHTSAVYMLFLSLSQYLDLGNYYLLNLENILLALVAIYFFYKIICYFSLKENQYIEVLLVTIIFAFNPVFIASSINLNIDFPVAVFLLASIYSLINGKMFLFMLFCVSMVFSKESGILLSALLICSFIIIYSAKRIYHIIREKDGKSKLELLYKVLNVSSDDTKIKYKEEKNYLMDITKNILYIFSPIIFLVIFLIYKIFFSVNPLFWGGTSFDFNKFSFLFSVPFNHFKAVFTQIFIFDFHWIFSILIILSLIYYVINKMILKKSDLYHFDKKQQDFIIIILLVLLGFSYVNFAFDTFTNPRYILPAIPLLIILAFISFQKISLRPVIKNAILVIIITLNIMQTYYTIDPVSKMIYGTFKFGKHGMLKMVSITGEPCGYAGRDQLVYNTEFTVINKLIKKLYEELSIEDNTPIFLNDESDFFIFTPSDKTTFHKTFNKKNSFKPLTIPLNYILTADKKTLPQRILYINFPWMAIEEIELSQLAEVYKIIDSKVIDYDGYTIKAFVMQTK